MDTQFNHFKTPESTQAYLLLGQAELLSNVLRSSQLSSTALDLFDKAINTDPTMYLGYEKKGDYYLTLEQTEDALKCFNKALELNPACCHIIEKKGLLLRKMGQNDEADKFIADFEAKYPGELEAFRFVDKMRSDLMDSISPQRYASMYQKTQALYAGQAGNYELALKLLEVGIGLEPDFVDLYHDKAFYLLKVGRTEDALNCYEKILELAPDDIRAASGLVRNFIESKQEEKAEKILNDFTERNPENLFGFMLKGQALVKMGKIEEGINAFNKAIEIDPNNKEISDAYNHKAQVARNKGNYEEAVEHLTKSIELDPEYLGSRNAKGDILVKLNKLEDALKEYMAVLEIDPNDFDALEMASMTLCDLKRYEEAIELLEKICGLQPSSEAFTDLGRALKCLGLRDKSQLNLLKASLCYQKAIEFDPSNEGALAEFFSLLSLLKMTGDTEGDEKEPSKKE